VNYCAKVGILAEDVAKNERKYKIARKVRIIVIIAKW